MKSQLKQISAVMTAFYLMLCRLVAGSVDVCMENDFAFHDDSDYTHGTRIGYSWGGKAVGVQQQMYTPYDLRNADPVPGRHVYAGTLVGYLGDRVETRHDGWMVHDDLELQLGVLGPSSHAGETQKLIHKWLDCKYPAGWRHQLHDEAIVQLAWWKGVDWEIVKSGDWSVRLDSEAGGMLGTLQGAPGANLTLLAGRNVPSGREQELSVRSADSRPIDRVPVFRLYAVGGASGRWWLWNELLDGNARYVRHGVGTTTDKEPLTGCLKAGVGVGLGRFDARVLYLWCTREFKTQETTPNYASIAVSWRF